MLHVQFIEKLVDDTVLRRTSSSSPSPTANSKRCFTFRFRQLATRKIQKAVETTQVQFKEMNLQYRKLMPTFKKIPKTVEIIHAAIQGQKAEYVKTDEMPQAQFMPRRCTTASCAELVPTIQEIQKTD